MANNWYFDDTFSISFAHQKKFSYADKKTSKDDHGEALQRRRTNSLSCGISVLRTKTFNFKLLNFDLD